MSNISLSKDILQNLRENKVITEQEIVSIEGDIYVAKNVLSDKKRIIDSATIKNYLKNNLNENSNKRLLKD